MKFLEFTYKVPSEPSKNRVHVWRSIKELGAVYLQQGVALLPYEESLYSTLKNLREQVNSFGGRSTIGELNFLNEEDEREILSEFKRQIDGEYEELKENCQSFMFELDHETEMGKFEFPELEEAEEEVKKLQRWCDKIAKRNYFHSENEEQVKEMLDHVREKVQQYSNAVYEKEERK